MERCTVPCAPVGYHLLCHSSSSVGVMNADEDEGCGSFHYDDDGENYSNYYYYY